MSGCRPRRPSGKDNKSKPKEERTVEEETEDVLLRKHKNGKLVSWRPRRPISDSIKSVPFGRIARVVHLDEAFIIDRCGRMEPRPITDFSAFHPNGLPDDHPCKKLRVLWFCPQEHPDANSKYGNVEFSLDIHWVLDRWKKVYHIENISYPTVTLCRVLLTNTDYGKLFSKYAPTATVEGPRLFPLSNDHPCNPWASNKGRFHTVREDCPRYKGEGFNKHGLILEFLIEATDEDTREIVRRSRRRSRNHFPSGIDGDDLWCHKYARRHQECTWQCDRFEVDWLVQQFDMNFFI
ncbi:uncharacterized protein LOC143032528 [Oratosquilla oratoria]|uniref:uncharacterized protein LOC143032528 n=1 Tax=Oratosquilla oratoria TaxID=337810 RepID=UPI003F7686E7